MIASSQSHAGLEVRIEIDIGTEGDRRIVDVFCKVEGERTEHSAAYGTHSL